MICKQCKKEFTPSHPVQIYCSKECYKVFNKIYAQSKEGKEDRRKAWFKYSRSDKGKKNIKKYLRSDERKRAYRRYNNSDKGKKIRKKYRQSDVGKEAHKRYKQSDKGRETTKKFLQSDEEKKIRKKYRQSDKGRKTTIEYWHYKYSSDPMFKLTMTMRARLKVFLKATNMKKTNKTFKMVGCTPKFLKEYLEKQFKPGMTWQNYSLRGWHVDHKKPISSAKTPEDVKKLMHYTNLQPLWANENLSKYNKLI